MQTRILEETRLVDTKGWIARIRPPTETWNDRVILLLHGWTGDENIMWIFARKFPTNSWVIAPRGPIQLTEGGYAWAVPQNGKHPDISQFTQSASELLKMIPVWIPDYSPNKRLDIVGFSQGAALTYALSLESNPHKIAPLAGYMPSGFEEQIADRDFTGLNVFIAHNTDDLTVSIKESKKAVDLFSAHGAKVDYCNSTGGHKISSACFRGFDEFMLD
jgi:predicted esterase